MKISKRKQFYKKKVALLINIIFFIKKIGKNIKNFKSRASLPKSTTRSFDGIGTHSVHIWNGLL